MYQCNCFEQGDDLGEMKEITINPSVEITEDHKHIYVDDMLVWCGKDW